MPGLPGCGCREKDELANAKLQQMVSGQNEAERRKGDAETLSTDLEKQNNRIAQRRHQVFEYFSAAAQGTYCSVSENISTKKARRRVRRQKEIPMPIS